MLIEISWILQKQIIANGFENHFSNMCAPCDDFLYPTFPWLPNGNFNATVSKALKPKQYHMCWLSFTISHEKEKNYFRVAEKHNDKYGSTTYMVLFMFCFALSLEVWEGRLSTFLRHMILFNYGKPVISTGGNIFLMEYIYRYYPAWSSLMLLLTMQQKPLFSWFSLWMRDCICNFI